MKNLRKAFGYGKYARKTEEPYAPPATQLSDDERNIIRLFKYMRPKGSPTEQAFVDTYLRPLGFTRDPFDNLVVTVGEDAPWLFSAHLDTVHDVEGIQSLHYGNDGILRLSKKAKRNGSNCLGADDTAGIWLIMEMVKAGVPGTYIIHHGEESGCIGSSDLAKGDPMWLSQFRFAMAFDRAYQTDVITHQMGRRTCSDAFAKSLSAALGGSYRPDDGGSYTDTNEYAGIIPECTNVSVGYRGQHGDGETQDVKFLIWLRDRLLTIDYSSLVIERDPTRAPWDDDDYLPFYGTRYGELSGADYAADVDFKELVLEYPDLIVDLLEGCGINKHDILDQVSLFYGYEKRVSACSGLIRRRR
ncbi:hypothetical protein JQ506_07790 [Shinella sp. PSBB067]|uniref:hypothetical protein n=1 Tax=Shinella sp. PSBB067 TaxID=2715959 RepID=UPI00193C598E|nr:hypothetical protein [Shinella sp. PSBB067]QRI64882.1 hypothetical protein JQ506_07790 [Shinella sp. PSBB067]